MSLIANLGINLDTRDAAAKLRQFAQGTQAAGRAAQQLQTGVTATGRAMDGAGRQIQTAANGLRYYIDAAGKARAENGRVVSSAEAAAAGISTVGKASRSASVGISTVGTALQAALGPIAAITGAVGALTSAFQTISAQDFAEAKVRSLGTNSAELVTQLKAVSAELGGQASVAELTAAAYDVASAGFVKASDAALVLKAASLGATGGFSDINTVGNAATSVLNAYGLSAQNAGLLVDRFIQTQNDGKVVVAEYAANIGKVASAAAGLNIPLEEVNAVIAQSTAAGNQAEVTFTGLKGALARLASGEATKALEGTGIEISAATVASDGLLGTLKKLEKLDTGQIFRALGTEAGPVLLPILQDLERFEQLIKNQENSAGAAARAQAEAANTIQGAWKAVQTELSNLFSDQSELGAVIKLTLQGAAVAIKILGGTINFLLGPIKAVLYAVGQLVGAFDQAFDISGKVSDAQARSAELQADLMSIGGTLINDLSTAFEPVQALWGKAMEGIGWLWGKTTKKIGEAASVMGGWIQNIWNKIANGASWVIRPIANAFSSAFSKAQQIVANFYNKLPAWLKSALSTAGSIVGGVTSAVGKALRSVGVAVKKAFDGTGKKGDQAKTELDYKFPTPAPAGAARTDRGGGSARTKKEAQDRLRGILLETAQLEQQTVLRGLISQAQLQGDQMLATRLQGEERILAIQYRLLESLNSEDDARVKAALSRKAEAEVLATQQGTADAITKIRSRQLQQEIQNKKAVEDAARVITDVAKQQERQRVNAEEYGELLRNGTLPDEAQRIINFKNLVYEQLKLFDIQIDAAEAAIIQAQAEGEITKELKDRLEVLRKQRKAVDDAAVQGPGPAATDADRVKSAIDNIRGELNNLTNIANIVINSATLIGDAFAGAFEQLVTGAGSAREVLSNFFKEVAQGFLKMATQIIAKQITMLILQTALKALGAVTGGGSSFTPFGADNPVGDFAFGAAGPIPAETAFPSFAKGGAFNRQGYVERYARGGVISRPTMFQFAKGGSFAPGLMGEAGPEAILPLQRTPNGRLGVTMAMPRQGAPALRESMDRSRGGGGGATVMNMSFQTTRFMDREWVDREQLEAAMAKATKDGGAQGERRALAKLQNSPRTRSRLALR